MTLVNKAARPRFDVRIPGDLESGVWANFATIRHSPYEFTLDFVRLDFKGESPVRGVLVQRVNMSPMFVAQLIDVLNEDFSIFERQQSESLRDGSWWEVPGDDE
ncbi:MAG: DUF3467 domain-containing protein [bacterium]|nr:DUF3467 domain-containing protein [bacterium]MYE66637.1 DUF3467 domain-containing protein [Acidimicrobiia bacterium]